MKRTFLAVAALALLMLTADTASARPRWGVGIGGYGGGYYGGYPGVGYGVSYGTRIGNNGYLSLNYGGYAPVYGPRYYSAPVYYSTPYYSSPYYYGSPYSYGYYNYSTWGW